MFGINSAGDYAIKETDEQRQRRWAADKAYALQQYGSHRKPSAEDRARNLYVDTKRLKNDLDRLASSAFVVAMQKAIKKTDKTETAKAGFKVRYAVTLPAYLMVTARGLRIRDYGIDHDYRRITEGDILQWLSPWWTYNELVEKLSVLSRAETVAVSKVGHNLNSSIGCRIAAFICCCMCVI